MKSNRSKNAIMTIIIITVMQILSLFYSLVSKRLFLDSFSLSTYGVIDLFGSFFTSLLLLEMGFGTILIYNLYKPLAANDKEEIKKQLSIFKAIYLFLIMIVLVISLALAPFLYSIFNISVDDIFLVYEVYFCNIITIIIKYWTLNKVSILSASQYKYVEYSVTILVDFLCFAGRILAVKYFDNIYMYVFLLLIYPALTNTIETVWINKRYGVRKIKTASFKEVVESGVVSQCKKYIFATIYSLFFLSMDNIIISAMLSTDAVAYVSNYHQIINTASQFVIMLMTSFRGIIADYRNNSDDLVGYYSVFSLVSSLDFIFVSAITIGLYVLMGDFISLWLGSEYIITIDIFASLLAIGMLDCIFEPLQSIFVIEGYIFKEKLPLIISALTNLVLTIMFINYFGLIGAYIATIIALFIKWFGKFYYILKGVFRDYKLKVILRYTSYIMITIVEMIILKDFASTIVPVANNVALFVYKTAVVVMIIIILNGCIIMLDSSVREYLRNIFKQISQRIR